MQHAEPDSCTHQFTIDTLLKHWPEENQIYARGFSALHFFSCVAGNTNQGRGFPCNFKNAPYLLRRDFIRMRCEMHSCSAYGNCHIRAAINQQAQQARRCTGYLRKVFEDRACQLCQVACIKRLIAQLHEVHTSLGPAYSIGLCISSVGNGAAQHSDSLAPMALPAIHTRP